MEHYPRLINTETAKKEILETGLTTSSLIQKNNILDLFHRDGTDSVAAMTMMGEWVENQEMWAAQDVTLRRSVILEIARSDFYLAVQDKEGALECLDGASFMAGQEGHFDLQDTIEKRIGMVVELE